MTRSKAIPSSALPRDGIPVEKLQTTAKAYGFGEVSTPAITRWRRAGLLPEGWIEYLGRNGSRRMFPRGSERQLIALCRIHLVEKEKRLPYVGWRLWWDLYDVRMDAIRGFLAPLAESWDATLADIRDRGAADTAIESAATLPLRDRMVRPIRKRVGSASFGPFLAVFRDVVAGRFSAEGEEDARLVEKGMGLGGGRTDRVAGADPWLVGGIGGVLEEMSSTVRGMSLVRILEGTSDERLTQTRNRMKLLLETLGGIGAVLRRSVGRGAFGLTVFSEMTQHLGPADQGILLLNWIATNVDEPTQELLELEAAMEEWNRRTSKIVPLFEELREQVPAFKQVWTPRRMQGALRSKRTAARLNADLARVSAEHRDEVELFLKDHPEISDLIGDA
jgi:hypothetical protein